LIFTDQGRSARIVTAEDATLFLRSSLIAASSILRDVVPAVCFGNIRTAFPGLTFHICASVRISCKHHDSCAVGIRTDFLS
jgi:hypothetical protein